MADFNEPVTGQKYVNHFASIRDKDTSLVKMLDGTSDTNLPTGAKRVNSGQKYRLEQWDGSSWNMVAPGFGNVTQTQADYLTTLSSNPLQDNDLASKGGSVAEVNRTNTFSSNQVFQGIVEVSATAGIGNGFKIQSNSGTANDYRWVQKSDTKWAFTDETNVVELLKYDSSAGTSGQFTATKPLDCELYDNGNRVARRPNQAGAFYALTVNVDGGNSSASIVNGGGSGWSISYASQGDYRLNHGLGMSDTKNLIIVANPNTSPNTSDFFVTYDFDGVGTDSNNAQIRVRTSGGNTGDTDFQLYVIDLEA